MRPRVIPCAVQGCGRVHPFWQAVCSTCWPLLPVDYRAAIRKARDARAKHLEAKASIAAVEWLNIRSPWAEAARRTGDDRTE